MEPEEGFADGGAGDAEEGRQAFLTEAHVEGEVAEEEALLELVVGALAAEEPGAGCMHPRIHRGRSVRSPDCRSVFGDSRSRVAHLSPW